MSELEWAAGFWDGEGSCYARVKPTYCRAGRCTKPRPHQTLWFVTHASISQYYSPEVLHRFRDAVGIGKVYGPYAGGKTNRWDYRTTKIDEVESLLLKLWPHICHPKREQAGAVLTAIHARQALPRKLPAWWRDIYMSTPLP